jgi:hypothetical protein
MEVWSASRSGRFTHRERATGTDWIGGWVGPRAGLDTAVVKRKTPSSRRESKPTTQKRNYELFKIFNLYLLLFTDVGFAMEVLPGTCYNI